MKKAFLATIAVGLVAMPAHARPYEAEPADRAGSRSGCSTAVVERITPPRQRFIILFCRGDRSGPTIDVASLPTCTAPVSATPCVVSRR